MDPLFILFVVLVLVIAYLAYCYMSAIETIEDQVDIIIELRNEKENMQFHLSKCEIDLVQNKQELMNCKTDLTFFKHQAD